jgi:hypothetical protein
MISMAADTAAAPCRSRPPVVQLRGDTRSGRHGGDAAGRPRPLAAAPERLAICGFSGLNSEIGEKANDEMENGHFRRSGS